MLYIASAQGGLQIVLLTYGVFQQLGDEPIGEIVSATYHLDNLRVGIEEGPNLSQRILEDGMHP